MLAIQPGSNDSGDEELRSVGVRTSVGHGQEERLRVSQLEVLIGEFFTINGLATGTVSSGEVTALQHKAS